MRWSYATICPRYPIVQILKPATQTGSFRSPSKASFALNGSALWIDDVTELA